MGILNLSEVRAAILETLEGRLKASGIGIGDIDGNFDLFGSGLLDSLGFVELLMTIEQKFGHPLDLEALDFGNLDTFDALVEQLYGLQADGHVYGNG